MLFTKKEKKRNQDKTFKRNIPINARIDKEIKRKAKPFKKINLLQQMLSNNQSGKDIISASELTLSNQMMGS